MDDDGSRSNFVPCIFVYHLPAQLVQSNPEIHVVLYQVPHAADGRRSAANSRPRYIDFQFKELWLYIFFPFRPFSADPAWAQHWNCNF